MIVQSAVALVLLVLVSIYFAVLKEKLEGLNQRSEALAVAQSSIDVDSLQGMVDKEADRLRVAKDALSNRIELSVYLDELARLTPVGITYDTVNVNSSPKKIEVKGRAQTREQVVRLHDALEQSKILEITFAPLSNLTEAINVDFEFILSY